MKEIVIVEILKTTHSCMFNNYKNEVVYQVRCKLFGPGDGPDEKMFYMASLIGALREIENLVQRINLGHEV